MEEDLAAERANGDEVGGRGGDSLWETP